MRLIAKDSLLLIPPEKVDTFPFLLSYKLTDYKHLFMSIYYAGNPLSWQNILTCSAAESSYHNMSNWGQTPIIFRIATIYSSIFFSSILTSPLDFPKAPIKILIRVDFPAPFYPNNPTIYPFLSSIDIPLSA